LPTAAPRAILGPELFEVEVALFAGVAMFIALASLFLNRPVHSHVAMTDEISLRGLALPVGGINEKVLAAAAAGLRQVLLPARNREYLDELPASVREQHRFAMLEDVDQAMRRAMPLLRATPAPN
jgi:ATP-dependent Lon protease